MLEKDPYMQAANHDPYLDAGMRGWIYNTAVKSMWRVPEWYTLDELVADGYMKYYQCRERYKFLTVKRHPLTEDKTRFMSLVQSAFNNHITTLSNKRTAVNERPVSQFAAPEENEAETWTKLLPEQAEEATLRALLADAPQEVQAVIQALASDGAAAASYLRSRLRRKETDAGVRVNRMRRSLRETTNEYLCRLTGYDPLKVDLASQLRQYFGA
jgi:hypothetical protein